MPKLELTEKRQAITQAVLEHVEQNAPLLVLKAPPGSGKTYTTLRAVALSAHHNRRVAVGTQTNAQADDFCRRMATDFPRFRVTRFASADSRMRHLGRSVDWAFSGKQIASGPGIFVANTAKWAATDCSALDAFDVLFIDEAWQMCWADFMLMSHVAPRFVLVGDPGQIAPVVPIDVSRWQTSRRPPHFPAPEVILRDSTIGAKVLELPVSTRLPHDTVTVVRAFYDFHFDSWAKPDDRRLQLPDAKPAKSTGIDAAIDLLTTGSMVLLTLPTPSDSPVQDEDVDLAKTVSQLVMRLLERGAVAQTETETAKLEAADIGISATHRVMNTRIQEALGDLSKDVRVDTPERWQGLERKVMVVVHPLSGTAKPSGFDLNTGRLCVMTSRHTVGLVIVSRDHVKNTLEAMLPEAEQALGLPDESGKGRARNLAVWRALQTGGRIVSAQETP